VERVSGDVTVFSQRMSSSARAGKSVSNRRKAAASPVSIAVFTSILIWKEFPARLRAD
jgi:hypothetical protein